MVKKKSPSNFILGLVGSLVFLSIFFLSAYDFSTAEGHALDTPIISTTEGVDDVTTLVTLTPAVVPTEGSQSNVVSFTLGAFSVEEWADAGYVQVSSIPINVPVTNLSRTGGKLPPPFAGVRITGFTFGTLPADWARKNGLSSTSFHNGLDMNSTPLGQPVVSSCNGTVLFAGLRSTVRAAINVMCSPETLPGHTVEMRYYHMDENSFNPSGMSQGVSFIVGQILGMLAPGSSCGTLCEGMHLHLEILIDGVHVDPALYLSL